MGVKMACFSFSLKWGQDLESRAAHLYNKFWGAPMLHNTQIKTMLTLLQLFFLQMYVQKPGQTDCFPSILVILSGKDLK